MIPFRGYCEGCERPVERSFPPKSAFLEDDEKILKCQECGERVRAEKATPE